MTYYHGSARGVLYTVLGVFIVFVSVAYAADEPDPQLDPVGTLTVIKTVINDNGGTADEDDFNLTVANSKGSFVEEVESGEAIGLSAGEYIVSEMNLPGYVAGLWGGDCDGNGNVTIGGNENKTCTITNNDVGTGVVTASLTASPNPTATGNQTRLTWNSANAASCSVIRGASSGFSTGGAVSGNDYSTDLTETTTFEIRCTGTAGSATASKTVSITGDDDDGDDDDDDDNGGGGGSGGGAGGGSLNETLIRQILEQLINVLQQLIALIIAQRTV